MVFLSAFKSLIKKGSQKEERERLLSGNSAAITLSPAASSSFLTLGNQLSLVEPPPLPGINITL